MKKTILRQSMVAMAATVGGVAGICGVAHAETKVSGFMDFTWSANAATTKSSSGNTTVNHNEFSQGALDIFLGNSLGQDISWLAELALEAGDDNTVGIDYERALIKWAPRDEFNISFGRFHTGLGYWNDTYHHGAWFQTSVTRPNVYLFEDQGGLLPVHTVGIEARGIFAGRFGYILNVGNGRGLSADPPQNRHDVDSNKAVNALVYANLPVDGLRVGAGMYKDHISECTGTDNNDLTCAKDSTGAADPTKTHGQGTETITDAHIVYKHSGIEFITEGHQIVHELKNPTTSSTTKLVDTSPTTTTKTTLKSFFVHLGVEIPKESTVYYRYETITGDKDYADLYLGIGNKYARTVHTAGLRHEFADTVAVKAELAQDKVVKIMDADPTTTNWVRLNTSWAF